MIWPPLKAWTSKFKIYGQVHFVAINYGGELLDRWVILMSVLDSSLVLKVYWSQLVDTSHWKCGWGETNYLNSNKLVNNTYEIRLSNCKKLSIDSGLTIPISKDSIRPWFGEV